MKKNLAVLFLISLLSLSAFAAIPQQMNYQGRLKNSSGSPLTGSYSIVFTIYDAASGGTDLWNETQSVTAEAGLFSVILGSVTPIGTSVLTGADRWLGIKVESDAEMTPRQKLVSVANAYKAGNADNLGGLPATSYATTGASSQWATSGSNIYYNTGKIGIGTATPDATVSAVQNASVGTGPSFGLGVDGQYISAGIYAVKGNADQRTDMSLRSWTGSAFTEKMRIASGGNVGIGTSEPQERLDIFSSGTSGNSPFLLLRNISGATPGAFGPGIILRNYVSGKHGYILSQRQDSNSYFSIATPDNPWTDYFVVDQTGKVGIGTTVPNGKLTVTGPGATNNMYNLAFFGSDTDPGTDANIYAIEIDKVNRGTLALGVNKSTATGNVPGNSSFISTWAPGTPISIGRGSGGLPNSADVFIQANTGNVGIATTSPAATFEVGSNHTLVVNAGTGKVGIGTASPGAALEINYPTAGQQLQISGGSTQNSITLAANNGAHTAYIFNGLYGATPIQFAVWDSTASAPRLFILNSGEVGIGTVSPGQKLSVAGTIEITSGSGGGLKFADGTTQTTAGGGTSTWSLNGSNVYYNSGNVGIGTAEPTLAPLDVRQNNGNSWFIRCRANSVDNSSGFWQNANKDAQVGLRDGAGNLDIVIDTGGNTWFNGNGNVGIGTVSPSLKLDVQYTNDAYAFRSYNTNSSIGAGRITVQSATGNYDYLVWQGQNYAWWAGLYGDDKLRFGKDLNIPSLTITSAGSVGIGTTDATSKLAVAGTIEIKAGSGGGLKFADGSIQTVASGASQWAVSGNNIYSTNSGNVGIGKTAPNFKMHVVAGNQDGIKIQNTGTTGYPQLRWTNSDDVGQAIIAVKNDPTSPDLRFWIKDGDKMVVNSSGNVGIGTAEPSYLLDVYGSAANIVNIQRKAAGAAYLQFSPSNGTATRWQMGAGADSVFRLMSGANVEQMVLDTAGNVGIGTAEPGYGLDVEKATGITFAKFGSTYPVYAVSNHPYVGFNMYYNGGWKYGKGSSSKYAAIVGVNPDTGVFNIQNTPNPGNADATATMNIPLAILPTGNVGVGTASPGQKLSVAGTIEITSGSGGGLKFADGSIQTVASGASQWAVSGNNIYSTNSGNVGIGKTAPNFKMHVVAGNQDGIKIQNTGTTGYSQLRWTNSDDVGQAIIAVKNDPTSPDLRFWIKDGDKMVVNSSGNVGIGTAEPGEKLEIAAADATVRVRNVNDAGGAFLGNTWGYLQLGIYNPSGSIFGSIPAGTKQTLFAMGYNGKVGSTAINPSGSNFGNPPWRNLLDNGAGNASFGTTDATSRLTVAGTIEIKAGSGGGLKFADGTIQTTAGGGGSSQWTTTGSNIYYNSGNVGIGTVEPGSGLHIYKNDNSGTRLRLANPNSGAGAHSVIDLISDGGASYIYRTSNAYSNASIQDDLVIQDTGGGDIAFFGANETMRLTNAGKVGIGTTEPATLLDVYYPTNYAEGITLNSSDSSGNSTRLFFNNSADAGNAFNIMKIGTGAAARLSFNYNATPGSASGSGAMSILDGGNVGIGTAEPASKLTVAGTVEITSGGGLKFADGSIQTVASGASQWAASGNNIYSTNSGNVGIGLSANIDRKLHLYSTSAYDGLKLEVAASGNGAVQFIMSNGNEITDGQSAVMQLTLPTDSTPNALFLLNRTNGGLHLGTNNSTRLSITSAGNVGIGTAEPTAKLHVFGGGLRVQNPTSHAGFNFNAADGYNPYIDFEEAGVKRANVFWNGAGDYFAINNVGSNTAINDNGGNVGIGTAAPDTKLHVDSGNSGSWAFIRLTRPTDANSFEVGWYGNNGSGALLRTYGANPLRIYTDSIERMRINGAGNVGIGTTEAAKRLDVVSSTNLGVDALVLRPVNLSQSMSLGWQGIQTSQDYVVYTGGANERMRILSAGNVGIGTVEPQSKLHVADNTNAPWLQLSSTAAGASANTSGIMLRENSGNYWNIVKRSSGFTGQQNMLLFSYYNGSTWYVPINLTADGMVGIGATPNYVLDVQHASSKVNSKNGYLTDGADYAEYFENEEIVPPGSLVGIDISSGRVRVYREGDEFVGIATTAAAAGFVGNSTKAKETDPNQTLVGLLGQLDLNSATAKTIGRIVYTPDMKKVGIMLSNGKIFVGK